MSLTNQELSACTLGFAVVLGLAVAATLPAHAQTFTTLYRFCSVTACKDGVYPTAGLVMDAKDNLYGTTQEGGAGSCAVASACGTLFKVTGGRESVLYNFKGGKDRESPTGGNLVMDGKGNLYGATGFGGGGKCSEGAAVGCGTVFRVVGKKETVLYRFKGGTDGFLPFGNMVIDGMGNLYGSTIGGGVNSNCGVKESRWDAERCSKCTPAGPRPSFTAFVLRRIAWMGAVPKED